MARANPSAPDRSANDPPAPVATSSRDGVVGKVPSAIERIHIRTALAPASGAPTAQSPT